MPSYRHKRGTLAQIDAAAVGSQLKVGEVYFITDENRLCVAQAVNAHTPLAKKTETSAVNGTGSINVSNGRIEHEETIAASGVTPASRVTICLAHHEDADENDATMIDMLALSAAPLTDQIKVSAAFFAPTAGIIKINWIAT